MVDTSAHGADDEVVRIRNLLRNSGLLDETKLLELSKKIAGLDFSAKQLEKMQEEDVERLLEELGVEAGLTVIVRSVLRRCRKPSTTAVDQRTEDKREMGAFTDKDKTSSGSPDGIASVQMQQTSLHVLKGPDVAEWSDVAVGYFLDFFSEKYLQLKRANFKSKDWQEVVRKVNIHCGEQRYQYDYKQCKNKLDSLKKKFKAEKERVLATGSPSRWKWYGRLEELTSGSVGGSRSIRGIPGGIDNGERKAPPTDSILMDDEFASEDGSDDPDMTMGSEMACEGTSSFRKEKDCWYSIEGRNSRGTPPFLALGDVSTVTPEVSGQHAKGSTLPRSSVKPCKKRRKGSFHHHGSGREIARIVTDALEKMEERRMEFLKELERERNKVELRRTEMQLEIAKLVLKSKKKKKDQDSDSD